MHEPAVAHGGFSFVDDWDGTASPAAGHFDAPAPSDPAFDRRDALTPGHVVERRRRPAPPAAAETIPTVLAPAALASPAADILGPAPVQIAPLLQSPPPRADQICGDRPRGARRTQARPGVHITLSIGCWAFAARERASMALDELLDRISKFPRFTAGAGASAADVAAVAHSLGVKLPDPYAQFLGRFGWAWWPGGGLYGIQNEASLTEQGHDYDTARVTDRQRHRQWPAGFKPLPKEGNVLHVSEEVVFLYGADAKHGGQAAVF